MIFYHMIFVTVTLRSVAIHCVIKESVCFICGRSEQLVSENESTAVLILFRKGNCILIVNAQYGSQQNHDPSLVGLPCIKYELLSGDLYSIKLEFDNFTLLFCGLRQRSVLEVITHVQTIDLLIKPYCFAPYSLL